MSNARLSATGLCLLAAVASTSGCLWHTVKLANRVVTSKGTPAALMSATSDQLVQKLRKNFDSVRSFNATVDMIPATGSIYKGEITEYKDLKAYVLYRSPANIRVIGLAPVVRSKVFDMVSTGQEFSILIPPKNRYVEGKNSAPPESKNSLENLRPDAFVEAMLIPPPDEHDTVLLVDITDEAAAQYMMILARQDANGGKWRTVRTVTFDRIGLNARRQRRYDGTGTIVSDTKYQDWKKYPGGVPFPSSIDITRPKDGYGVTMNLVKLSMNPNLGDDKFVLAKPEGVQLQVIGATALRPSQPSQ